MRHSEKHAEKQHEQQNPASFPTRFPEPRGGEYLRDLDDDGARDWEPLDGDWEPLDDGDGDDGDTPVDVRWSMSSRVFEEVADSGHRAGMRTAGLLDAFVEARLESSANITRGVPRKRVTTPTVVELSSRGRG